MNGKGMAQILQARWQRTVRPAYVRDRPETRKRLHKHEVRYRLTCNRKKSRLPVPKDTRSALSKYRLSKRRTSVPMGMVR
jgi:hypothetical protein